MRRALIHRSLPLRPGPGRATGARVVAALGVEQIAGVLDEGDLARRKKRDVVETALVLVRQEEERQLPRVRRRAGLGQALDRSPAARAAGAARLVAVLDAEGVRVARLVEEELLEARAWAELAVLGPLERRPMGCLRERVRVERRAPVDCGVVDGDPLRVER